MQLCAGLPSGCEAGAAALQKMWEDPEVEAIILIDARNAFNSLNRAEAINATWQHCPMLGQAFQNCTATPARSASKDTSTTQGCPLGMAMYAVGSIPLIQKVTTDGVRQIWYADDSGGGGKVEQLRRWYDALEREGPHRGYFIKLSKTAALVKPGLEGKFREHFGDLADPEKGGMTVVVPQDGGPEGLLLGKRYLGVGVGNQGFRRRHVADKIEKWTDGLRVLSKYARTDPHPAYCLLTKSVIPSWRYTMRTMPVDPEMYRPLEEMLVNEFFPAAFGWKPETANTRERVALPVRHGGLALPDVCKLAETERSASQWAVWDLTEAILRQDWTYRVDREILKEERENRLGEKDLKLQREAPPHSILRQRFPGGPSPLDTKAAISWRPLPTRY